MLGIFKSLFGKNSDESDSGETAAKNRLQKLRDRKLAPSHSSHSNPTEGDDASASLRDLVQSKSQTHEAGISPFNVWTGVEGKAHSVGITSKAMVSPFKGGAFGYSENPLDDDIDQLNKDSFAETAAKKKLQFDLSQSVLATLISKHGQIERNLDPEPGTSSGQYDVVVESVLASDWSSGESLFSGTGLYCDYGDTLHETPLGKNKGAEGELDQPLVEKAKCFGPPIDLNKLQKPVEKKSKDVTPVKALNDDDFVDEVLFHYDNCESLFEEALEEDEEDDEEAVAIPVVAAAPKEAPVATPKEATPAAAAPKAATPVAAPKAATAAAPKAATPAAAPKAATAAAPKAATPAAAPKAATPAATPKAATPVAAPKATTPAAAPKATTPAAAPKATTPAAAPKATTPAAAPKAATPAAAPKDDPKQTSENLPAIKPNQTASKLPATKPNQSSNRLQAAKPASGKPSQTANRLQAQASEDDGKRNLQLSDLCDSMEIKQFSHPYDKFSESSLKLIAQNAKTPPGALAWLAAHRNPHIRAAIAKNPSTPIETFWVLARDHESSIRYSIAENLYMSPEILRELSRDRNPLIATTAQNVLHSVRESLMNALPPSSLFSKKTTASGQSLEPLKPQQEEQTGDEEFLLMISRKATTPARRLKELAKHANAQIRAAVAENGNTPVDVLWLMARDADPNVKIKLAENCNLPEEILDILKDDRDSFVVKAAQKVQTKLAGLRYTGEAGGNDIRHVITWS